MRQVLGTCRAVARNQGNRADRTNLADGRGAGLLRGNRLIILALLTRGRVSCCAADAGDDQIQMITGVVERQQLAQGEPADHCVAERLTQLRTGAVPSARGTPASIAAAVVIRIGRKRNRHASRIASAGFA